MNIPQEIDKIIEQRKSRKPLISDTRTRIGKIKQNVEELELVCKEASSGGGRYKALFEQHPEIAESFRLLSTENFNNCYKKTDEILEGLEKRFSREQIHISFVGRAGQGKSLVMQNISGLSGNVIPSADGADCTGAKSIITNQPGQTTVSAEITFYTKTEYLGIINKYLREVFGTDVPELDSVNDISGLCVTDLRQKLDSSSAKKQSLYFQLEKYIEHSADVLPLLGTTKNVSEEEIEHYVAQYSSTNKEHKYYIYLGVKVANILCNFPYADCGKIVLVDTIGLGATALDLKKQMLETVGNDSDVIILMTRPDGQRPHIEQDDIDIVNDIANMVTAEYTRRMLFWIINKVSGGVGRNIDGIPDIEKNIDQMANFPIAGKIILKGQFHL